MKILSGFCGYSCDDIAACKKFYSEVLGIELREEMGGLGFTLPGGTKTFIYPKEITHR